jgi:hypothetical protein
MRPLQAIGMGLVIVVLTASYHGYDVLADPLGWLLVLVGLDGLPPARRGGLPALAGLALVVSVVVWFPGARDALNLTDAALAWAASLPELLTVTVLAHRLARAAAEGADAGAAGWLRTARALLVVSTLLPPVVLGGGLLALRGPASAFVTLSLALLVVLLFAYAARPWAPPVPSTAAT